MAAFAKARLTRHIGESRSRAHRPRIPTRSPPAVPRRQPRRVMGGLEAVGPLAGRGWNATRSASSSKAVMGLFRRRRRRRPVVERRRFRFDALMPAVLLGHHSSGMSHSIARRPRFTRRSNKKAPNFGLLVDPQPGRLPASPSSLALLPTHRHVRRAVARRASVVTTPFVGRTGI